MRFDDYFAAVVENYPDKHFDKIMDLGWNKVDLVKKVAELMFIDKETETILAEETRKQLISLATDGVHCFDV